MSPTDDAARENAFLAGFLGDWTGECSTWLQPNQPPDVAPIRGRFAHACGDAFLRHVYHSSFQGQPRSGEETLAYNPAARRFELSWIDTFHTAPAILYLTGARDDDALDLRGPYATGPDAPDWTWRAVFRMPRPNELHILAYNVSPQSMECKAAEIRYRRAAS